MTTNAQEVRKATRAIRSLCEAARAGGVGDTCVRAEAVRLARETFMAGVRAGVNSATAVRKN